eukprot:scaffold624_cov402-Prasinococcus_capsulatus_cf.AAC.31
MEPETTSPNPRRDADGGPRSSGADARSKPLVGRWETPGVGTVCILILSFAHTFSCLVALHLPAARDPEASVSQPASKQPAGSATATATATATARERACRSRRAAAPTGLPFSPSAGAKRALAGTLVAALLPRARGAMVTSRPPPPPPSSSLLAGAAAAAADGELPRDTGALAPAAPPRVTMAAGPPLGTSNVELRLATSAASCTDGAAHSLHGGALGGGGGGGPGGGGVRQGNWWVVDVYKSSQCHRGTQYGDIGWSECCRARVPPWLLFLRTRTRGTERIWVSVLGDAFDGRLDRWWPTFNGK